jgi:hypothetical protein
MVKLLIQNAQVMAPALRKVRDVQVQVSKVNYMGGSLDVPNPNKHAGEFSTVEIDVELTADARAWAANDGRSGAMIATAVRPVSIASVKK